MNMNPIENQPAARPGVPAFTVVDGVLSVAAADAHQASPEAFLQALIAPGALVFDVGANVGANTRQFLACGARVVCFEPQPDCVRTLRQQFEREPRVTIAPVGLAAEPGRLKLAICSEINTLSTFAKHWQQGRFAQCHWKKTVKVDVLTLEDAIRRHGRPDYAKIDVEGFELEVLRGLNSVIGLVSFEFTMEFLGQAEACLQRLEQLGYREFNAALSAAAHFAFSAWLPAPVLLEQLRASPDRLLWGDLFARGVPPA